jgi:hypothetical protein
MPVAPSRSTSQPAAGVPRLQAIAGFEATDYALLNGRVVWAGAQASTDHPRNFFRPWQPSPFSGDTARLQRGALNCMALLQGPLQPGLLTWLNPSLGSDPLPWWLTHALPRLNSLALALQSNDPPAFEHAALRLLGLGPGLTPSGDDLVGAIFFALRQAPRTRWAAELPALRSRVRAAAHEATNVISAALLDDLLDGHSYRPLHELMTALDSEDPSHIAAATQALLRVGASSGADMLSGVLLTLGTWQETF